MRIVTLTEEQYGNLTGDPYYEGKWERVLVIMDDHTDEILDTLWFDSWQIDCPEDLTIGRTVSSMLTQLGHTIETYTDKD